MPTFSVLKMKNISIVFLCFGFSSLFGLESKSKVDDPISAIVEVVAGGDIKKLESIIHPECLSLDDKEDLKVFLKYLRSVKIDHSNCKSQVKPVDLKSYVFKMNKFLHAPDIFVDLVWPQPTEAKPNKKESVSLALGKVGDRLYLIPYVSDYLREKVKSQKL